MVVVTGATGHLGGVLVRRILQTGVDVRVLTRKESNTTSIDGLPVQVADCGFFDAAALERAFSGASVVYHAAARISFAGHHDAALERDNVEATRRVIAAARSAKVGRLVHVGSIEAFPISAHRFPITEVQAVDPAHTVMEYGRSKAEAMQLVAEAVESGLNAVTVCPTSFIGPPDFRPSPVGRLIRDFLRRKLPAYVTGGFDFVDVRDVAEGTILAGEKGRTGERYLLSGHYASVPELLAMMERCSGVRKPWLCLPPALILPVTPVVAMYYNLSRRPPRFTADSLRLLSHQTTVSSAKAERELGYRARPLEETVRDTIEWFLQQDSMASTPAATVATRETG